MPSQTLKTLPAESVAQLAHVLQFLPHEPGIDYNERFDSTIQRLSSNLKHRPRLLTLLSTNAPPSAMQASLCVIHKSLSASLIHEIFTLFSLEVGHNCNSFTRHNSWLSPEQNAVIHRLRELHSLWLPEQSYCKTFMAKPNPVWSHQQSKCEGCILTRIGSNLGIVADLRALLLSRTRTVKPIKGRPRLLRFVDEWIFGLVGMEASGMEIMRRSEMEGKELKRVRKRIWAERREVKRRARKKAQEIDKDGEEAEDELRNGVYDSDFENEIIDHYAALRSTMHVPTTMASPAQTPSLTTGPSDPTLSSHLEIDDAAELDRQQPRQASSIYSSFESHQELAYEPPRRGQAWRGKASAGTQAEGYRTLLTPPPENRLARTKMPQMVQDPSLMVPPLAKRPPQSKLPEVDPPKRQTRWSEFL